MCLIQPRVWSDASRCYGDSLYHKLDQVLASYRRQPGYDAQRWVFRDTIGHHAYSVLYQMLKLRPPIVEEGVDYFGIRVRLLCHLQRGLLMRLVSDGHAGTELRDLLLSSDLGL